MLKSQVVAWRKDDDERLTLGRFNTYMACMWLLVCVYIYIHIYIICMLMVLCKVSDFAGFCWNHAYTHDLCIIGIN